jgi:MFS transporter, DHA2 family, methylenomycin A resistance protein
VALDSNSVPPPSRCRFLRIERERKPAALVPLDLFLVRTFSGGIATTAAMTFGMYGIIFLMPLVRQSDEHLTPREAGLTLLSMSLAFFVVSTQCGRLSEHVGARLVIAIGTGLIGCGSLVLAITDAGTPMVLAQIGLTMAGIGMGLNSGPLYGTALASVGQERSGTASPLITVARMAGATMGVASLGSVFVLLHGGPAGFQAAMLVGGTVQDAADEVATQRKSLLGDVADLLGETVSYLLARWKASGRLL